ncbi:hypothetical protein [Oceaniglobus roseus]|nr:hypothetical protein [Kandeliimicrobium roseum]
MATRRWLKSALNEAKKPQPKLPWQQRKAASVLSNLTAALPAKAAASA